jgi:diadenosine tetraphosphate (Ap4A) HIT family hydrolase
MRKLPLPGGAALALLFFQATHADVRSCQCDLQRPETLAARECSLCKAAEAQPQQPAFFVIRDASPNKPNRQLALPRFHGRNPQDLGDMTADQRAAYWKFAIEKAREAWSEDWGLAVNSVERRTQCHAHIHIGKLRPGVESDIFTDVDGPADIPLPRDGDGLLVHPAGRKLHVHTGNDAPELMLER